MCSVIGNSTNGTCFQNKSVVGAPRCINLLKTYEELRVLVLLFYIVVMVLAILGNTLIIYIVYSNKPMRTSTNIFIVNMAVCDLGIPFFVLPKKISELFVGAYAWLIPGDAGLVLCKLLPFVHDVFITCSIFSLLLITYDRFCAVMLPHKRHDLLSKKVVIILISFAWVLSIIDGVVVLKTFLVYHVNGKRFCNAFWYPRPYIAYFITITCLTIVTPIVLVTIAYSAIFHKLKKQVLTIGDSLSDHHRQQEHLRQKKIIKMAFAIICAFAVCWLPYAIMIFIRIAFFFSSSFIHPCWFWKGLSISYYFMVLVSLTNPAICFIFGTTFRDKLCKILRRVFGCRFPRRVEVVDTAMSEIKL